MRLQPVINGTGILIHTNLGRAPLGPVVQRTLATLAGQYSNLELDLETGGRGTRAGYLEHNLALLCGAPAATVVNNCAAALVLVLRCFAAPPRVEVLISRGELIQIGGGFRIPEILEASGARLREVGTTNKTALSDYEKAITRETGMILKVHRSNFTMNGFVGSPATEVLSALARRKRLPLVEDLGSGAVVATESIAGIAHEPTPGEALKRGVDLVCCSGDKLFGGPQAGIIAGKERLVAALKRDAFFRAVRCDKLILGALEATVDLYLRGEAMSAIPTLEMAGRSNDLLRERARQLIARLARTTLRVQIGAGQSQLGGGSLPGAEITSVTLDVRHPSATARELATRLRAGAPPVVGTISGGALKIDLRTVFPEQDEALGTALRIAAEHAGADGAGSAT